METIVGVWLGVAIIIIIFAALFLTWELTTIKSEQKELKSRIDFLFLKVERIDNRRD